MRLLTCIYVCLLTSGLILIAHKAEWELETLKKINYKLKGLLIRAEEKSDNLLCDIADYDRKKEKEIQLAVNEAKEEVLRHIPNIRPVWNWKTSRYSLARMHPIFGVKRPHLGDDFQGKEGDPIFATADGVVFMTDTSISYGYKIHIIHYESGYHTVFAHLSGFNVLVGDTVSRGEIIGYMGSTGLSTGNHLHYEVRYKGRKINPRDFYRDYDPTLPLEDWEQYAMSDNLPGFAVIKPSIVPKIHPSYALNRKPKKEEIHFSKISSVSKLIEATYGTE